MEFRFVKESKATRSLRKRRTIGCFVMPIFVSPLILYPLYDAIYGDEDDFLPAAIAAIIALFVYSYFGVQALKEELRERAERRRQLQEQESELAKRNSRMLQLMKQFKGQRLPADRQNHLRRRVPLYSKLPDKLKPKLEERMLVFLEVMEFKKKKIPEITKEMRDIVAAEACLLIVNRSPLEYLHLEIVEIWKGSIESHDDGTETIGTAFKGQRVQLDWEWVDLFLDDAEDNSNVILHEFAHILDFADDAKTNSIPVDENSWDYEHWKSLLEHEYPRLQKAHASGQNHVMDDYSISRPDQAEFFSCATESFFERPSELKEKYPRIYGCLKNFYRLDPAEW